MILGNMLITWFLAPNDSKIYLFTFYIWIRYGKDRHVNYLIIQGTVWRNFSAIKKEEQNDFLFTYLFFSFGHSCLIINLIYFIHNLTNGEWYRMILVLGKCKKKINELSKYRINKYICVCLLWYGDSLKYVNTLYM